MKEPDCFESFLYAASQCVVDDIVYLINNGEIAAAKQIIQDERFTYEQATEIVEYIDCDLHPIVKLYAPTETGEICCSITEKDDLNAWNCFVISDFPELELELQEVCRKFARRNFQKE